MCTSGRTGRAGKGGVVTSLVAKRDKVLSDAIQSNGLSNGLFNLGSLMLLTEKFSKSR